MHNNWPWETRVGQLASIAGVSLAVCSFTRMLWRSMGAWAVGPGVVLGLMFFMGAALATTVLEALYRAL
jgi:negative regulator of sigma E activity